MFHVISSLICPLSEPFGITFLGHYTKLVVHLAILICLWWLQKNTSKWFSSLFLLYKNIFPHSTIWIFKDLCLLFCIIDLLNLLPFKPSNRIPYNVCALPILPNNLYIFQIWNKSQFIWTRRYYWSKSSNLLSGVFPPFLSKLRICNCLCDIRYK